MFLKIREGFEQAKQTLKLAEPRPEDIQAVGWAKPGKIKRSMIQIISLIQTTFSL